MSLWRKRGTSDTNCDTIAPNVHHNEQKPDHLVNMVTNLSIQSKDLSMQSKKIDDDDDIQVYVKPWVGLTNEDKQQLHTAWVLKGGFEKLCDAIETILRGKNT